LTIARTLFRAGLRRSADESFATLFHQHYARIYGILYRLVGNRQEAEDLAQEVFWRLHRQVWQPEREHNVAAWLYRVAINMGYNALRARKRRVKWEMSPPGEDWPAEQPTPHAIAEQNEERDRVRAVLAELPSRQSTMLLLRYAGFRYRELADICQVAPASVGTLLARAERAFEAQYRARWPEEESGK